MKLDSAMEVISIIGAKGGLGKSCLAVNLANYLSMCGIATLLVDCDFNTNGATNFMEMNGLRISADSAFKSLEVLLSRPVGNEFEVELTKPEAEINESLSFVPTTLKENAGAFSQFKEEELKQQKKQLDRVFEQWREKYSVIILDHPGGYTDLANFFLSYTSKILLINADNISGIKTARSLYRRLAITNQEIVQCINKYDIEPRRESESLIKKCYGFKENKTYRDAFAKGDFFQMDLEEMRTLTRILIALLPAFSNDLSAYYEEEKARQEQLQENENRKEQLSRTKKHRLIVGVMLAISALASFFLNRYFIEAYLPSETAVPLRILLSIGLFVLAVAVIQVVLITLFDCVDEFRNVDILWDACKWYLCLPIELIRHAYKEPEVPRYRRIPRRPPIFFDEDEEDWIDEDDDTSNKGTEED